MTAKPVSEEPEVDVFAWAFVIDRSGVDDVEAYRLVAFRIDDSRGRLSSPVIDYDAHAGTVRTFSGRLYHLHGVPDHANAERALAVWRAVHGVHPDAVYLVGEDKVALACAPRPPGPWN